MALSGEQLRYLLRTTDVTKDDKADVKSGRCEDNASCGSQYVPCFIVGCGESKLSTADWVRRESDDSNTSQQQFNATSCCAYLLRTLPFRPVDINLASYGNTVTPTASRLITAAISKVYVIDDRLLSDVTLTPAEGFDSQSQQSDSRPGDVTSEYSAVNRRTSRPPFDRLSSEPSWRQNGASGDAPVLPRRRKNASLSGIVNGTVTSSSSTSSSENEYEAVGVDRKPTESSSVPTLLVDCEHKTGSSEQGAGANVANTWQSTRSELQLQNLVPLSTLLKQQSQEATSSDLLTSCARDNHQTGDKQLSPPGVEHSASAPDLPTVDAEQTKVMTSSGDDVDVTFRASEEPLKLLRKGEMLLVELNDLPSDVLLAAASDSIDFTNCRICYTRDGCAYVIPAQYFDASVSDPAGHSWFYPLPLTDSQATGFLRAERHRGCFIVYRLPKKPTSSDHVPLSVEYRLAVCSSDDTVCHYRIRCGMHGDYGIDGDQARFLTLPEMVNYFRHNRGGLVTRLRRPLTEARLPPISGRHYESTYDLDRSQLRMSTQVVVRAEFGVVWAAVYGSSRLPVSVKVMQHDVNNNSYSTIAGSSDATDDDAFIDEVAVMSKLNHSNVVKLFGVSCASRPYLIVTEGSTFDGSLKDCLRNGTLVGSGGVELGLQVDLCMQAASAVVYLHSFRYILHRDLAARNFLLSRSSTGGVRGVPDAGRSLTNLVNIKLTNFGRARQVSRDDVYRSEPGEPISVKWASPEVLTTLEYSSRSDIWALGVVCWEILTGRCKRPYSELSAYQTAVYVLNGGRLSAPAPEHLCPPEIYDVITSCWDRRPESRPTATQFVHQLAALDTLRLSRRKQQQQKTADGGGSTLRVPLSRASSSVKNDVTGLSRANSSAKNKLAIVREMFSGGGGAGTKVQ